MSGCLQNPEMPPAWRHWTIRESQYLWNDYSLRKSWRNQAWWNSVEHLVVWTDTFLEQAGWVWGGGDTNQAVFQRKGTRPKQSLALPSISWDTPTIPYQAQGSSQHSLSFCQQVSDFSRRKMCLVFFFVLLFFSLLPIPPTFFFFSFLPLPLSRSLLSSLPLSSPFLSSPLLSFLLP